MTNKIRWEIDAVPDAKLNWIFEPLTGTGRTPAPLVPRNGEVILDLMHAPRDEHDQPDDLPDGPCNPLSSTHFHMYFPLFGTHDGEEPSCEPEAEVEDESSRDPGIVPPGIPFGPNVFSCMLGQAKVDPTS